jgi:hypothetical protein
VDEHEANYLRGRVRELERSRAWWRAVAGVLAGVVVALALAGGVAGLMLGKVWADKRREDTLQRAFLEDVEEQARMERARVRERDERWKRKRQEERAEELAHRRDAAAPVAGGLGVAAHPITVREIDPDFGKDPRPGDEP